MNKNTQNENRKMSKLSSYLKVSCSALILSSSLVGYGFTKDAFAQHKMQKQQLLKLQHMFKKIYKMQLIKRKRH